ncbi:MAG: hypothetical protein DWC09_07475 [Candidatus Poseidoniales archaeon]|nr:MAG: hypothetical protein DWC09_07475 [Candidatus Poseidoniales archaeon]
MGRGEGSQSKCLALCITALFLTCLLPLVSATGGGAVLDVSSFSLADFETTEDSTYDLQFDIIELLSSDAEVEVQVELSTLDGTQFAVLSQNLTVAADSVLPVQFSLTSLPYGYTNVDVELLGEIGSPNSTQAITLSRTLHRLQPADISLATSGQILLSGLTSNGAATGNVSIHDGDYLRTEVAIINDGDFSWTGTLSQSLNVGSVYENQTSSEVTVDAQSSFIVFFTSTLQLTEGSASLELALNDTGDGDSSDETRSIIFEVSPPPLPLMTLAFSSDLGELTAGDAIEWNLSVSNTGTLDFDGQLVCMFGQETLYDAPFTLSIDSMTNLSLQSTARPDLLSCSVLGMRISTLSTSTVSLAFDIESAAFEFAGSSIPAVLNGPWHEGDTAVFSMLVRNHGEKMGHVMLVCETLGIEYASNALLLDVDAAGEVSVSLPMSTVGDQAVNWSLSSTDGSIDSGLNGTVMVPVAAQQTLTPKITSVAWDAVNGVTFEWSVEMSEGIDRPVRIRLGYTESGLDIYPMDYEVTLSAGTTSGAFTVGFVDSERVSIRATPLNWTTGFGFSSFSLSIPDERPSYSVDFNPLSTPNRPLPGQTGSVTVQVRNSADVAGAEGYLVVSTQGGLFLGEKQTDALGANSDSNYQFSFEWPDLDSAPLKVTWVVGDSSFTATNTFQSGVVVVEEASFEFPWVGVIGGVMLAVVIGAVVRIYQNRSTDSSVAKPENSSSSKKKKKAAKATKVEKIQIGCPECERQLRVPADYGGQVRCPDCSNRFDVTPRIDSSRQEVEEEPAVESDGKIEIHCPECTQSLRIPEDYTGSVRCPACEEVFSAVQTE